MAVRFEDSGGGVVLTLPPTFRVEADGMTQAAPMQTVPRRHGAILNTADLRQEARSVSVSGVFAADTPQEAEQTLREWAAALSGKRLRLYPGDESPRFMEVVFTRWDPRWVEHSGRTIAQVRGEFRAPDPVWQGTDAMYLFEPRGSGATATVNNPGSVIAMPVITIYGTTVSGKHLARPKLTNRTNGHVVELDLTLEEGVAVRIYPIYDRVGAERGGMEMAAAILFLGMVEQHVPWGQEFENPVNVLPALNESWFIDGFALEPGDNVIEFTDDATSVHQATVVFEWRPAWF